MQIIRVSIAIAFVFLASSCAENPVTGKKELRLMSAAEEVTTGEQNYLPSQQQQGGEYNLDPALTAYVNSVGQKLAQVSDRPGLPYEFVVLNNSVPNAWALPGGKIAVNRGLLDLLDDEAQLAAVIGHEIVHAAAGHTAQQMTQSKLLSVGVLATGIIAQNSEYGDLITAGAGVGAGAYQARYGRDQELESDKFGVKYMIAAGYDPQAAVELQEKFMKLSEGRSAGLMESLFASHPPSQDRVKRNQALVAGHTGGVRNKAAYSQAMRQIKQDRDAYAAQATALELAQKKEFAQAIDANNIAIQKQPKEALFYVTKGQLLMANKQDSEALSAFQKAASLNPNYYAGHLGAGMLLKKANNSNQAKSSLETSMKLLPTPTAAYYLGELSLGEGDRQQARTYFQFAAQGTGEIAEAAKGQLAQLPQ
jgi:beta-barrel assembly-enhancing protease